MEPYKYVTHNQSQFTFLYFEVKKLFTFYKKPHFGLLWATAVLWAGTCTLGYFGLLWATILSPLCV
eukprot:SAG31_NODE_8921_length_1363_cov_1.099684_1_plen_66_part_00